MWRSKEQDLGLLKQFFKDLKEFQHLKLTRWEKIDDKVQENNHPGTPSEDWIIPPDENKTEQLLIKDHDYVRLKSSLLKNKPHVEQCGKFLNINTHHKLDWLVFETPLIGNSALEDALSLCHVLEKKCENSPYFLYNLKFLIN